MLSNRLSVVAAALSNDPRKAPGLARLAGFKGVLLDVWSANLNIPDLSLTGRRELARVLSAQDQQLVGLRMDVGPKGLKPGADVDRQIERIDSAMESAVGMQSPLICIDLGPLPQATIPPKPKSVISKEKAGIIIIPEMTAAPTAAPLSPPPDPAFVSQVQSALSELGSCADRYGVMLGFSSSLSGFASINESLTTVRCPWFGVDLDPVALLNDEWQIDEVFSTLGSLIRHVRARDAIVGDDSRTRPTVIGHGSTNWPQLISRLDEAGYSGFLTVDPMELINRQAGATAGQIHLAGLG